MGDLPRGIPPGVCIEMPVKSPRKQSSVSTGGFNESSTTILEDNSDFSDSDGYPFKRNADGSVNRKENDVLLQGEYDLTFFKSKSTGYPQKGPAFNQQLNKSFCLIFIPVFVLNKAYLNLDFETKIV